MSDCVWPFPGASCAREGRRREMSQHQLRRYLTRQRTLGPCDMAALTDAEMIAQQPSVGRCLVHCSLLAATLHRPAPARIDRYFTVSSSNNARHMPPLLHPTKSLLHSSRFDNLLFTSIRITDSIEKKNKS